ncbi:MAG: hypothetical protein F6J93_18025 [Oscillatoria sp. SIO1A7]|nr:hypothetical protein [Oscillatoria sp. SIO1A7]
MGCGVWGVGCRVIYRSYFSGFGSRKAPTVKGFRVSPGVWVSRGKRVKALRIEVRTSRSVAIANNRQDFS